MLGIVGAKAPHAFQPRSNRSSPGEPSAVTVIEIKPVTAKTRQTTLLLRDPLPGRENAKCERQNGVAFAPNPFLTTLCRS